MREQDFIFGATFFIAQKLQVMGDRILSEKVGITIKQWMLLITLINEFPEHLPTISEAAKKYGTSRQNLKKIALSLQKKGFVLIAQDSKDSRIQRISLTGKHKKHFEGEQNEKWQHDFIDSLFENFSETEITNFSSYMKKLIDKI